jgi:DNA-binding NarL/FixJ family response regulator
VFIVDENPLAQHGLLAMIGQIPGLRCILPACSIEEAAKEIAREAPDLMILSSGAMSSAPSSFDLRQLWQQHQLRSLVVGPLDVREAVAFARIGADGVLTSSCAREIAAAAEAVLAGSGYMADDLVSMMMAMFRADDALDDGLNDGPRVARRPGCWSSLTTSETDVLRLLCRGYSNSEIAERLHLACATVKSHVSSLLSKLSARDRLQLVVIAFREAPTAAGLVTISPRAGGNVALLRNESASA